MEDQLSILFLCAGYGTRLQRDASNSPAHSHLLNRPKALLPLNDKPLLNYWIKKTQKYNQYLVSNSMFYQDFINWGKIDKGNVIDDGSVSNDTRLGAVGDLTLFVKKFRDCGDLLVIAGDTLFLTDFSLDDFLKKKKRHSDGILVTCVDVPEEGTYKNGILELDEYDQATRFLEKPGPDATKSRLGCPCFYYLPKECLSLLDTFMSEMKGRDLSEYDASGKFISWLVNGKKFPVYAMKISGRLDIGGLSSYIEADEYATINASRM